MQVPRIGVAQRRARLAWRHRLIPAARTDDPVDAADAVVAFHATDPASVHLAALARCTPPEIAATERALYDERSLVRMLGMRRTVFVVPSGLAPIVQAACTRDIAARERRRLIGVLGDNAVDNPETWLSRVEAATLAALEARGEALAVELSDDVPDLRRTVTVTSGRQVVELRLSTRVLFVLAAQGRIVRGRPRGTWLSSQYRWAPARTWLGRDVDEADAGDARAALAARWLGAFGPAAPADLQWWAGWTKTQTRAALARLDVTEVDMDGAVGVVLANDLDGADAPPPWAALLSALDPTPMGWRDRTWYLGDHAEALFDRSGNIGPTVWWEGRVVGGWVQRDDGAIVHRLLEDVGADARAAIDGEVTRLQPCLADVTVVPRFHTPLERELRA